MRTPYYNSYYDRSRFVEYPRRPIVRHPVNRGLMKVWAVVSFVLVELAAANVLLATVRLVHLFGG